MWAASDLFYFSFICSELPTNLNLISMLILRKIAFRKFTDLEILIEVAAAFQAFSLNGDDG
ncbi:hypothetical protein DXZ20_03205 [Leptolyngbyaceae cyanobacterium CCMR0081]|uniref:Uncharacterized protein n=1 Tax=Adonisia turfae CCMR0081 TaxID=2292702 RepID=A0A6M0RET3_9CYAN|nr:hypothetical protein [Adonisia turfae CCMR0081]